MLRTESGGRLSLPGRVDDAVLQQLFATARVYLQPSLHEGFGSAVAEAMLHDCIPVVPPHFSLPEVVGPCGVYADPTDLQSLEARVTDVLEGRFTPAEPPRDRILREYPAARREKALLALCPDCSLQRCRRRRPVASAPVRLPTKGEGSKYIWRDTASRTTMLAATSATPEPISPPRTEFLPFARPDIGEAEIAAVVEVLRSGWITTGPQAQAFEREFAEAVGAPFALAVNSCTAALHLALEALGVGAGDEVLTSTVTFTATAEVVEYLGGRHVFLDVEAGSLNITPDGVRAGILRQYDVRADGCYSRESGGRLRAVVPVHFGGLLCDMVGLQAVAREFGIAIVDDAAHAFPAARDERRASSTI